MPEEAPVMRTTFRFKSSPMNGLTNREKSSLHSKEIGRYTNKTTAMATCITTLRKLLKISMREREREREREC